MTKIFLTGSSGFIGKNLLKLLSGKFEFVAPTHKELDLSNTQIVKDFLQLQKFDLVIHSANFGGNRAQTGLSGVLEANKQMFLNLAKNSEKFNRMIFLGSGAEYGKQQPIVNAKETDFGKVKPEDEYGKAKYFASEYIATHPNIVNLRCFGIFGKYEDYTTRFISNAICRVLFGLPIILKRNVKFDYVYVYDLAKIIEYFILREPKEKFYNIGSGQSTDLLGLAEIVKTVTGGVAEIKVLNPGLNNEYTCDNSLLRGELKDFKFTPFNVAIGEMVGWYKANMNLINKDKLNFDA